MQSTAVSLSLCFGDAPTGTAGCTVSHPWEVLVNGINTDALTQSVHVGAVAGGPAAAAWRVLFLIPTRDDTILCALHKLLLLQVCHGHYVHMRFVCLFANTHDQTKTFICKVTIC